MFKNLFLAASAAAFISLPLAASAATCTIGTCTPIQGTDGDTLSNGATYNFAGIVNDAGTGSFTYSGNFLNDTPFGDATSMTTVLQFDPSTLGNIYNLTLNIVAPTLTAPQTFAITDGTGQNAQNPGGFGDVVYTIDLTGTSGDLIYFELTGNAVKGTGGSLPGVNMTLMSQVPLPAGVVLLGTALAGFGALRRRKRAS